MNKKVLFLTSGNGGTLKFLYYAIQKLNLPLDIIGAIADRECGAYFFAKNKSIPAKKIEYTKNNDDELCNLLNDFNPDIVITNIHKILTSKVLNRVNADFINLHYSLLPAFSGLIGMKTVEEAKKQNCKFIGATCHMVTEELDGGKIISQGLFSVDWNNDISDINDRVFKIACITFLNGILEKYNLDYGNYVYELEIFNPACKFDISIFDENFWRKIKDTN